VIVDNPNWRNEGHSGKRHDDDYFEFGIINEFDTTHEQETVEGWCDKCVKERSFTCLTCGKRYSDIDFDGPWEIDGTSDKVCHHCIEKIDFERHPTIMQCESCEELFSRKSHRREIVAKDNPRGCDTSYIVNVDGKEFKNDEEVRRYLLDVINTERNKVMKVCKECWEKTKGNEKEKFTFSVSTWFKNPSTGKETRLEARLP
jgi:hypothetical protein